MRELNIFLIGLLCAPALAMAITVGQVDDFQDGSLEDWRTGSRSPNWPANVDNSGPGGSGDRAMIGTANGGLGSGGKFVIFNRAQWAGDYLAAGVNAVRLDLQNLSNADLTIRLAFRGSGGDWATTQAAVLGSDTDGFTTAVIPVRPEDLEDVDGGGGDVMATLGNVTEVRILHTATPAFIGDPINAQLAIDNITALSDTLQCASAVTEADGPSDYLLLPAFEVDTTAATAPTTFFAVHNQTDEDRVARVKYFDTTGALQVTEDLLLGPRQTRTVNVRNIDGLAADPDDVIRGSAKILACAEGAVELADSFTGDYFYLDDDGNFATGDQLLHSGDICATLQTRLLDFGSGIRLRLYVTDPQGLVTPTATFTVYNDAGTMVDSGSLFTSDPVLILDSTDLTATRFGTLVIDFLIGGGTMSAEYSAFGRFSVAMNVNCVEPMEL